MNRRALIIGNTGVDLPGVELDLVNYRSFLLSPLGGSWEPPEVTTLRNPSRIDVSQRLKGLASADYSMVVFAGHGDHSAASGSTRVQLSPGVMMDLAELKVGATKHTVIADCCRVLLKEALREEVLAKALKREAQLNRSLSRRLYDDHLGKCASGLVVLYACDVNETAGESSSEGGYYSTSLLSGAKAWADASGVVSGQSYGILSVVDAHDEAARRVRAQSGTRQKPVRECPRTALHFPFAVVA